ncbi:MFS transporter, partial [Rhizobium ruizarguesonis]
ARTPAIVVARFLPRQATDLSELRHLDGLSLLLMETALKSLEISLKEAPTSGWISAYVLRLLTACLASGGVFVWRTLRRNRPI